MAGTGTLAMEMALVNTVAPGEPHSGAQPRILCDRFLSGQSFGIEADVLQSEWGKRSTWMRLPSSECPQYR